MTKNRIMIKIYCVPHGYRYTVTDYLDFTYYTGQFALWNHRRYWPWTGLAWLGEKTILVTVDQPCGVRLNPKVVTVHTFTIVQHSLYNIYRMTKKHSEAGQFKAQGRGHQIMAEVCTLVGLKGWPNFILICLEVCLEACPCSVPVCLLSISS